MKYNKKYKVYVASSPLDLIGWNIIGVINDDESGLPLLEVKGRLTGQTRKVYCKPMALPIRIFQHEEGSNKE